MKEATRQAGSGAPDSRSGVGNNGVGIRRSLVIAISAAMVSSVPQLAAATDSEQIEEVLVVGRSLALQRAQAIKRNSDAILDAVSSDEIGRLPNRNSAEAIESLPGVSLLYDQGEGRFVSIRGASPSLNNVTINGISAGTPEGDGRTVPLDVIGGELLSSIEVIKAVTPDMDAQAVGGTINVKPPSPFDYDGFFGRSSAQIGYEEMSGNSPYAVNGMLGDRFGPDGEWGYLLGGSYSYRDFESRGIFPDDWVVNDTGGAVPEAFKTNQYEIERTRIGFTGTLEHRPAEGTRYFLRTLYSDFQEDEYRQRIQYDYLRDPAFTSPRTGSTASGEGESELRYEEKDKSFLNVSLGGENRIRDWIADYSLTYAATETEEPNENWEFRGDDLDFGFDATGFQPRVTPGADAADPASYAFARYREQLELIEEDSFIAGLNFERENIFQSIPGSVKFGVKYRTTDKTQDAETPRWVDGSNPFTLADHNLQGPSIDNEVDGTTYSLGPIMDMDAIRDFTAANIDNPALFSFDAQSTLEDGFLDDYDLTEEVFAGYIMAEADFGPWTVLGGVRSERTETDAEGYQLANAQTVSETQNSGSYTNVLPNLHVRFTPRENLLFRFAWTNTIGRPGYGQISPTRELEFDEVEPGVFNGEYSEGNPDLDPYESMNFDLSVEYYFPSGGLASAALFYKDIDNPIFGRSTTERDVTFDGRFYEELTLSQPANADSGEITGIEMNYQKTLDFLPSPMDGLGVGASLTLVDSELTVPGREDEDLPFVGQADKLYSLMLFYQKGRFQGVISYDYADDYLDSLEGEPLADIYYNSYGRLDARASFQLSEALGIFLEFENINDEPSHEFQGGNSDWVTGYELYDYTINAGITMKW